MVAHKSINREKKVQKAVGLGPEIYKDVLARLKSEFGVKTDVELGEALGRTQQSVAGAKRRHRIPSSWIAKIREKGVSMDFVLYGKKEGAEDSEKNKNDATPYYIGERRYLYGEEHVEMIKQRLLEKPYEPEINYAPEMSVAELDELVAKLVIKSIIKQEGIHLSVAEGGLLKHLITQLVSTTLKDKVLQVLVDSIGPIAKKDMLKADIDRKV